ncbi:uncharacterized protein L969DRAFT_104664 [Mixia osmundae IAM 14324]|uniref:PX domain-containing protein n=1 Tax=Mixia osmundae (strain CBS 9802 / IAM 14324 / JCM 22182 / KY 12970) TaxID=764103 RepID=G7DX37_MIXOS|nr:uncharacterized protein L969DRAFT_104664 [Mixia osmundae IAM 14324]KEI38058.1 hypothetical protein L969DRAFT_104664 [Mixia osmundae IAM 14324]GAA95134.1 hypothetical protein E5Q_01789 [Mixia osmundae IAM 14324]
MADSDADSSTRPRQPVRRSTGGSLVYKVLSVPAQSPFERPGGTPSMSPAADRPKEGYPFDVPVEAKEAIARADPLALTPLRAHYLKRELVTLQFQEEISQADQPDMLGLLGQPFEPPKGPDMDPNIDLPLIKFVFHRFVLSFPFLAKAKPAFYKDKLQPFAQSFMARNISTSSEREEDTKRQRLASRFEKHLGLIVSSAIKLSDNDGREEVVRVTGVEAPGDRHVASPAAKSADKGKDFEVNVVSVRSIAEKGRVRTKWREEFVVRTRRRGMPDVYVSRRYGDFDKLAEMLRSDFPEQDVRGPPAKDRRSTGVKTASPQLDPVIDSPSRQSLQSIESHAPLEEANPDLAEAMSDLIVEQEHESGVPGSFSTSASPPSTPDGGPKHTHHRLHLNGGKKAGKQPGPVLARERNRLTLRAYVHHLLANPSLAASTTLQSFLLTEPFTLTAEELKDVEAREEMDRVREEEIARFRAEVDARVQELDAHLKDFREELVGQDGLSNVFSTIKATANVEDLPVRYQKVIEWARISMASTIYQLFVGSDNSSSVFGQLKRIHSIMPYFVLRGILRISNPVAMIRAFLDLFLARPFGGSSLLQRMFSSGLNDEVRELKQDMDKVAEKVAQPVMIQKLKKYVEAPKTTQAMYREEASSERKDIMTVILRSQEEPRLDSAGIARLREGNAAYRRYKRKRDALANVEDDEGPDNDAAWLYEDLHIFLRMATRLRDKEQLIELIFEGSTSELLKDIVTIFYEPLAKVYKAANIADSFYDCQVFVTDLIKTVEHSEEISNTDPQRTVQTFVDLVGRHENRFYHFVHQVHSKGDGLFDDLMKWIELFITFVRDGMHPPLSLEYLLPHAGPERLAVMKEVDAVVEYHRLVKVAHHERMQRRLMRGEGQELDQDRAFVEGVMNSLQLSGVAQDVSDAQDAASEDEHGDSSSDDDSDDEDFFDAHDRPGGSTASNTLRPKVRKTKRKKDRAVIEPPELAHIPQLVPLFIELIRPNLTVA